MTYINIDDFDLFQQSEQKVKGKCNCNLSYSHLRIKDRIKPYYNWVCNTCKTQFSGT